jgi:AcrR family transcriptional regulator
MNTSKTKYHHGDLKNAIISAAITLIKKKGSTSISLREVSKKAGVSHAAPYRHFNNKNDLLAAIAQKGFEKLKKQIAQAEHEYADDPKKQLIEAGAAYVELAVTSPEITQLMFSGYVDTENCSECFKYDADDAFKALLNIINNGCNKGFFIKHDPQALTLATWSMVHGFAMLIIGKQLTSDFNTDFQIRIMTRMLCDMLLGGIADAQ